VQPVLWRRKHEVPVEQAGTGQEPIEAINFWGWFCPDATMLWAATYSEADGLQLSVTQSRNCNKEESCAAGGHDDNDDNDDHSHSDGAAATTCPLAALFITIITIVITL